MTVAVYLVRYDSTNDISKWLILSQDSSQSSPLFGKEGTDQGVGHFKGGLNRQIF